MEWTPVATPDTSPLSSPTPPDSEVGGPDSDGVPGRVPDVCSDLPRHREGSLGLEFELRSQPEDVLLDLVPSPVSLEVSSDPNGGRRLGCWGRRGETRTDGGRREETTRQGSTRGDWDRGGRGETTRQGRRGETGV